MRRALILVGLAGLLATAFLFGFEVSARNGSAAAPPAVSVVVPTKRRGSTVMSAYLCLFDSRRMMVVPTQSAVHARSWFAMPNMGQMVWMLPARMK